MLVLTRKRSEKIQIGDDITIKVIRTGRSTVKIGIEAPDHVRVLRSELCVHPVSKPAGTQSEPAEGDDDPERLPVCSDQFPTTLALQSL